MLRLVRSDKVCGYTKCCTCHSVGVDDITINKKATLKRAAYIIK